MYIFGGKAMTKFILPLFLFSALLVGCSSSSAEDVKDLKDEELFVKHWHVLPVDRKISLIQETQSEGRYYIKYSEEEKDTLILLFDAGLRNTPFQENNLKKAMKEFDRDREITENSK
jgi:hypothetical protein